MEKSVQKPSAVTDYGHCTYVHLKKHVHVSAVSPGL